MTDKLIDTSYTVYYVNGHKETFVAQLPRVPSLKQLEEVLREWFPNYLFEHVSINVRAGQNGYKDMFVDEMGVWKPLPINPQVSNNPAFYPGDIYGTAVVFDRHVWF